MGIYRQVLLVLPDPQLLSMSSLGPERLFRRGDRRIHGPLLKIIDEWPIHLKDPPQLSHRRGMLIDP
jgi:hypothetical protein